MVEFSVNIFYRRFTYISNCALYCVLGLKAMSVDLIKYVLEFSVDIFLTVYRKTC